MFKALLANNTRKATTASQRIKLDDNCEQEIVIDDSQSFISQTLSANTKYCLTAKGFFLIGSKGAKISYEKDGEFSDQTSNAIGAISEVKDDELTYRKYQIIVSEAQTVYLLPIEYF